MRIIMTVHLTEETYAMPRLFSCVFLPGVCLIISGCLAPEKFSASIRFDSAGTYFYRYAGTVADAGVLASMAEEGRLGTAAEDKLRALARDVNGLKDAPARFEYLGNARYSLDMEEHLRIGEESRFAPSLDIQHGENSTIVIGPAQSPSPASDGGEEIFEAIGLRPEGTLQITLPAGARVIMQNADSSTMGNGTEQVFEWKIGDLKKLPNMVFSMPARRQ